MDKPKQTFSELLSSVNQQNPPSPQHSPSPTPPPSFTYSPKTNTSTPILSLNSQIDPFSCSPPKSITTSAPIKAKSFDDLFTPNPNFQPKPFFSNELRKSIRLSSTNPRTSYVDLEEESSPCMQDQRSPKSIKSSSFTPYDRQVA